MAPGVHIFTTDIMGTGGYGSGNYIPNFNGTSSATPHCAGLMGLILSVDPDLRSWEVEEIVKLTADDLGTAGRDDQFGFGRINARRALEAASRLWYSVKVGVEFLGAGRDCYMRAAIRMFNPGINTVRVDAVTLTSYGPTGAEIDRFEYRPNPGNVLRPMTADDVRMNGVLLKANGNQQSWSYRWYLAWNYTYWRPSSSVLPLVADGQAPTEGGLSAQGRGASGSSKGGQPTMMAGADGDLAMQGDKPGLARPAMRLGDSLTFDRQSRELTIVIR